MSTKQSQEACSEQRYEISQADLPLACPLPGAALWNAHPRVYLPIEETGREVCPYCGAEYILKDFAQHG